MQTDFGKRECGPIEPKRVSQVPSEMERLGKATERLLQVVERVVDRLSFVTRPSTPQAETKGQDRAPLVGLAQQIELQSTKVDMAVSTLSDTMERCEL